MKEYEVLDVQHLMIRLKPSSPEAYNRPADEVKRYCNVQAIFTRQCIILNENG